MTVGKLKNNLIYPDLSYKIVGVLYDVFNELGSGLRESYYQKAIAKVLKDHSMVFKEQVSVPVQFRNSKIGIYYLDFLIENKIILEIKKGELFSRRYMEQVVSYLKATKLKLGILANFTKSGVKVKRIVNRY